MYTLKSCSIDMAADSKREYLQGNAAIYVLDGPLAVNNDLIPAMKPAIIGDMVWRCLAKGAINISLGA